MLSQRYNSLLLRKSTQIFFTHFMRKMGCTHTHTYTETQLHTTVGCTRFFFFFGFTRLNTNCTNVCFFFYTFANAFTIQIYLQSFPMMMELFYNHLHGDK